MFTFGTTVWLFFLSPWLNTHILPLLIDHLHNLPTNTLSSFAELLFHPPSSLGHDYSSHQSLIRLFCPSSQHFWALWGKITILPMVSMINSCLELQRSPRTALVFFIFLCQLFFSFPWWLFTINIIHFNLPYSIPKPLALSKQPHFLINRQNLRQKTLAFP